MDCVFVDVEEKGLETEQLVLLAYSIVYVEWKTDDIVVDIVESEY